MAAFALSAKPFLGSQLRQSAVSRQVRSARYCTQSAQICNMLLGGAWTDTLCMIHATICWVRCVFACINRSCGVPRPWHAPDHANEFIQYAAADHFIKTVGLTICVLLQTTRPARCASRQVVRASGDAWYGPDRPKFLVRFSTAPAAQAPNKSLLC